MALIRVHTRRPLPDDLVEILAKRPVTWKDDGLSGFPDSVFGWDIAPAGSGHDALYCTRLWHAGALDRTWREAADVRLGRWVYALLPFGLRLSGYAVAFAVYELGGMKAFNSCGLEPYGASDEQLDAGLCRHGVAAPNWLRPRAA